jgi:DNA-binding transcriptional regulator YiaG
MPNIAKILKDEIQRLARREANQAITGLKKSNTTLKKTVTEHKRRIAALEKENRKLISEQTKIQKQVQTEIPDQEVEDIRITSKQIRSLRRHLGISQVQLAKLLGVSINIVSIWERKPGRINIRKPEVRKGIIELKGMKKVEVQERLEKGKPVKKKGAKPQKKKIVKSRITVRMIKSIRKKLNISQAGLAKLAGVSNQAVSKWETLKGNLSFRNSKTEEALSAVMRMTKKEAQRKLKRKKKRA